MCSLHTSGTLVPRHTTYAGVAMCAIFVVGLIVLPFAPETKGEPLPEDDVALAR